MGLNHLGKLTLNQVNGDIVWYVIQQRLKQGNSPATVNRYLALIRNLLKMARDEWQWIDSIPKIWLLPSEVERDRWLTKDEADRLIQAAPEHLAALIRFALATGCRAREITGVESRRFESTHGMVKPYQERHAERRSIEQGCNHCTGRTDRKTSAVLFHVSRQSYPLGFNQYGLG